MTSVMLFILLFSGLAKLSFTLSDLRCQHGWSLFGSRCFRVFTAAATWYNAEQNCVTNGGHLASVHSREEYTFVQALVQNATHEDAQTWLGANDLVQLFNFVWTDGSAFDYKTWAPHQPNHGNNIEYCLQMNYPGLPTILWNDRPCSYSYPSVCAKSAIVAKTKTVIKLTITSKKDLLRSDIEELVQQVKQKLIDSGMPSTSALQLENIYKKSS